MSCRRVVALGLVVFFSAVVVAGSESRLEAQESSAPVVVSVRSGPTLRVQVSEGHTLPCDSKDDVPLFDRAIVAGASVRASIAGDCICIRHTTGSFGDVEWSQSGLVCRPRVCTGKICRPAPDPTINVSLP